jgi:hypothetical protein
MNPAALLLSKGEAVGLWNYKSGAELRLIWNSKSDDLQAF